MNTKQISAMKKMTEAAAGGAARGARGRRFDRKGFTLVELLVVIALSGLILALLFAPIIQGFHITAKAKALVQAQDASRNGLEQFSREISQASYVFDNGTMPIILPLEQPDVTGGNTAVAPKRHQSGGNSIYPTSLSGGYIVAPEEAFGRIDLVSSDVVTSNGATLDPTTNTPIGGADLRVPVAPASHRYVRYFIGLLNNTDSTGTVERFYQNLYEFHNSTIDQDFNPFILYRAEYDPNDPNLISQTTTGPVLTTTSTTPPTYSAFDDANFFYNLNTAGTTNRTGLQGNGKTYAANWKAIASPVVVGKNLDMLIWRRNSNGAIDPNTPFTLGASFAPSSVVNDVATPGFLTNAEAEAPSALPTLYTSQFGAWTFPFTINVIRGSTRQLPVPNPTNGGYGSASFTFGYATSANGSPGNLTCTVTPATPAIPDNTLDPTIDPVTHTAATNKSNIYAVYSPLTGKYFVSTPSITFIIDPSRGRIETGIPPLATKGGVINFSVTNGNQTTIAPILDNGNPYPEPSPANVLTADLAPTLFRQSTLDNVYAGMTYTSPAGVSSGIVPENQGITFSDLQAGATDTDSAVVGYYIFSSLQSAINQLTAFTNYDSPFRPNGAATGFDGALLAIGTERVVGPDNNLTVITKNAAGAAAGGGTSTPLLVDYNRVPAGPADLAKNNVGSTANNALYARNSPLNYQFDPRLQLTNEPIIEYDAHQPDYSTSSTTYLPFLITNLPAGLPTPAKNDPTNPPATEVQVSFLWQNNYARRTILDPNNTVNGIDEVPIDVNAADQAEATSGTFQPEPDVFQVTYATRSLISVALSAHVYDIYSGQPVFVQVTDKVKVNNVGR